MPSCTVPSFFSGSKKIELLRHILKNTQISNLIEIRLVGAGLVHADRRMNWWTDRHDEANSRFSQFCECAQKIRLCLADLWQTDIAVYLVYRLLWQTDWHTQQYTLYTDCCDRQTHTALYLLYRLLRQTDWYTQQCIFYTDCCDRQTDTHSHISSLQITVTDGQTHTAV